MNAASHSLHLASTSMRTRRYQPFQCPHRRRHDTAPLAHNFVARGNDVIKCPDGITSTKCRRGHCL